MEKIYTDAMVECKVGRTVKVSFKGFTMTGLEKCTFELNRYVFRFRF